MKLKIGENVRKYRHEAGLTQEGLGEALGVSFQAISRWENETSYPDIEFLPKIAKYFGISVDALIGYGDDEKKNRLGSLLQEFTKQTQSETPDIERVIMIIREMRMNHVSNVDDLFWREARAVYNLPGVLPELRKLAETVFEQSKDRRLCEYAAFHMAQYEDDAHFEVFLENHALHYDLRYKNLRFERYSLRGDEENLKIMRQIKFRDAIYELMKNSVLSAECAHSAEEQLRENTFLLGVLNGICGLTPSAKHPVFCDSTPDEWSICRVELGVKRAGFLAKAGDAEGAFAVLEDTVSMYEKIVKMIVENGGWEVEVKTRCPWLDKATARIRRNWINEGRKFLAEQWMIGPYENIYGTIDIYVALTSETNTWFDPIRNGPRYQAYVMRISALSWNRKDYQKLYQYAMTKKETDNLPQDSGNMHTISENDSMFVCMLSEKGNIYHISCPIISDSEEIYPELIKTVPEDDTAMAAVLCYILPWWAHEIPSYEFRKALLKLNSANKNAKIFMNGFDQMIEKTLIQTMPPTSC